MHAWGDQTRRSRPHELRGVCGPALRGRHKTGGGGEARRALDLCVVTQATPPPARTGGVPSRLAGGRTCLDLEFLEERESGQPPGGSGGVIVS
jgi:hypothetical protein